MLHQGAESGDPWEVYKVRDPSHWPTNASYKVTSGQLAFQNPHRTYQYPSSPVYTAIVPVRDGGPID